MASSSEEMASKVACAAETIESCSVGDQEMASISDRNFIQIGRCSSPCGSR